MLRSIGRISLKRWFLLALLIFSSWRLIQIYGGKILITKGCTLVDVEVVEFDALDPGLLGGLLDAVQAVPFGSIEKRYEVIIQKNEELVASMGGFWLSETYFPSSIKIEEEGQNPGKICVKFARSRTIECELSGNDFSAARLRVR